MLVTTAKQLEQLQCPPRAEHMNESWGKPPMGYGSGIKVNEALVPAATQCAPQTRCATGKQPDAKDHILQNSIGMEYPE